MTSNGGRIEELIDQGLEVLPGRVDHYSISSSIYFLVEDRKNRHTPRTDRDKPKKGKSKTYRSFEVDTFFPCRLPGKGGQDAWESKKQPIKTRWKTRHFCPCTWFRQQRCCIRGTSRRFCVGSFRSMMRRIRNAGEVSICAAKPTRQREQDGHPRHEHDRVWCGRTVEAGRDDECECSHVKDRQGN